MVLSNISWHISEHVFNGAQFYRNKNESFKPKLLSFQETFNTGGNYQFLVQLSYFLNIFLIILTTVWNIKTFLIPWYIHPVLKKYILT